MTNLITVALDFIGRYKDGLVTITWIVAAIGWHVSNKQANNRESRKETRAEIEAIIKAVAELIATARKFYCTDPDETSDQLAASMSFEVHRIARRTERLEQKFAAFDVSEATADLHEALTSDPFQLASRVKLAPNSTKLGDIEEASHRLIDGLEAGFQAEFKVSTM